MRALAVTVFFLVLGWTGVAFASGGADVDVVSVLRDIVDAGREGQWRLVASGALVFAMWCLRNVREKVKWFQGDVGGNVLVALLSLAGALASSLATDMPIDGKMFISAIVIAWTASGGYTFWKKCLVPLAKRLWAKIFGSSAGDAA